MEYIWTSITVSVSCRASLRLSTLSPTAGKLRMRVWIKEFRHLLCYILRPIQRVRDNRQELFTLM